jgi:putative DNA primase/helicase
VNSMLEAAISYASRNLYVFPCEKKIPLTGTGGFKNAACDLKFLLEWWTKYPKAQIGIPTGQINHLFVIDVDGPQGEAALPKLNLPETFTVETRPGRKQFWFAQPDGVTTKNSAGALAPQIDTRGDGGYIIAPPSIHHETGKPYRVVKDLPWAEMPAVLYDLPANGNGHALTTDKIRKGKRHQTLLSVAGALRARGLSPQKVLATLRTLNAQQCEPPIDDAELQRLATFVGAKPAGFPGQRLIETSAEIEMECFSEIAPEGISWLWPGRIPAGKVTLFVGDPGKGKSLATIDLAARVSCGRAFPDGSPCVQGDVLILSAEDTATDTVRPRLDVAGADVGRVHRIKAVKVTLSDGQTGESAFSLERDLEKLEETLTKHPGFKLIIIDPLSAYLGTRANSWRDAEVRALLTPLVEFAARNGVAIVGIMHMRKSETDAMLRVSGSIAFVAAARVVWGFGEDPDDPSLRVMVPVKNNLAPLGDSLSYQIVGNGSGIPYLNWDAKPRKVDANEVLGLNAKEKKERAKRHSKAQDWLQKRLASGPLPQEQIEAQAKTAEIAWRTLMRAKASLGVRSHKAGMTGGWYWELPVEACHEGDQDGPP